jgi:prepilin-type N-terminal cleavage/methylation domain-containing protein
MLKDESGFTLPELLVGIIISVIVVGAAFAILDTSLRLNTRLADQVDANESAHTVMERMSQWLHSSCLTPSYAPVITGSTGTKLMFISESQTTGGPNSVVPIPVEHVIQLSGTTLTDTQYGLSAVNPGNGVSQAWSFNTTTAINGTPTTLLTGVYQAKDGGDGTTAQPIFTYYKYNASGELPLFSDSSTATLPYSSTNYFPVDLAANNGGTLASTDQPYVAEIGVNLNVAPHSGQTGIAVSGTQGDRSITMTDAIVLRFQASSAAGSSAPCD